MNKGDTMIILKTKNAKDRVRKMRKLINSAGDQLFAISFVKRSDGSRRKMVCRKHVLKTQYAVTPNGKKAYNPNKYDLAVVFDMNFMRYNRRDKLCGRGAWKSIPLDSVTRIKTGGEIYKVI